MTRDTLPNPNTDGALTLDQLLATAVDDVALVSDLAELQSSSGPAPTAGRVARTTNDGAYYLGDGSAWVDAGSVSWGSPTNPIPDLNVVNATATGTTTGFGGTDFGATEDFADGSGDLGSRIQTAISNDIHHIRVHEPSDNSDWSWDTDITHDCGTDGKLFISVDNNATVDYSGSGRPLTITATSAPRDNVFGIVGGNWTASASPTEWLLVEDMIGAIISPLRVDYPTSATGLVFRNNYIWNELNLIEGDYIAGNGIDFIPASDNPNSNGGTDSFQNTYLNNTRINVEAQDGFGVRVRGNFRYSQFNRPDFGLTGDGSAAIELDSASALGLTVVGIGVEGGSGVSNAVAIRTTSDYNAFQPPIFLGGFVDDGGLSSRTDLNNSAHAVPSVRAEAGVLQFGSFENNGVSINPDDGALTATDVNGETLNAVDSNGNTIGVMSPLFGGPEVIFETDSTNGGDFIIKGRDQIQFQNGSGDSVITTKGNQTYGLPVQDVTAISSPSRGDRAYHDGSGNAGEGPAYYDGTDWNVLDGGTQP